MPLYKKWVPQWMIHFCNFFLITIFSNALLMNIIGYDMNQVQGHFGATVQEFQLSIQLPIAIMLAVAPITMALAFTLPLRPCFLASGLLTALSYIACVLAPSIYWFTFFKTILCISGLTALLCTLLPLMLTYNPKFNQPLLFAILYSFAFGFADICKFSGTYIISRFNWEYGLSFFALLVLIAVLMIFIFLKKERVLPKPAGGGSLDISGLALTFFLFVTIVIILVKGPDEHWFESRMIKMLAALCIIIIGVYIFHSKDKKNAYVHLEIFTYKNTLIGGLLLIGAGFLMATGGAMNGLMGLSGFNNITTGRAYMPQALGVFAAAVICVIAVKNNIYLSTLAAMGFICMAFFHLSMFLQFYPDVDAHDFFWPMVLRGAGHVFLYLSLGIYVAENIPKHLSGSRLVASLFFKLILGTFVGGAAFGYFLSKDNKLRQTGISQQVTSTNQLAQQQYASAKMFASSTGSDENESNRFATKKLSSEVNKPASLVADKDIYFVCGIISFILALVTSLFKLMRHAAGKLEVEPVPL